MDAPFELRIALRYLLAKRKQAFISLISLVSTLGDGTRSRSFTDGDQGQVYLGTQTFSGSVDPGRSAKSGVSSPAGGAPSQRTIPAIALIAAGTAAPTGTRGCPHDRASSASPGQRAAGSRSRTRPRRPGALRWCPR